MTARQQFVTTIETAWSFQFPGITIPNIKILATWWRYYPIEIVLAAFEEVAIYAERKGITDADHIGRVCSRSMRQKQERELGFTTSEATNHSRTCSTVASGSPLV